MEFSCSTKHRQLSDKEAKKTWDPENLGCRSEREGVGICRAVVGESQLTAGGGNPEEHAVQTQTGAGRSPHQVSEGRKGKVAQSCPTFCDPRGLFMEFSRPEYRPFPSPGDLPNPGTEPRSPALQVDFLPGEPQGKPKKTGVVSLSLLQGIFPTQGLNPGLPRCKWILYQWSHKGSPRKLEWVAYPFSRGSSRPRNRTRVSCIAGRFFVS